MKEGIQSLFRVTATWIVGFIVILAIASFPRDVHYTGIPGHLWAARFSWSTYFHNMLTALAAPFTIWSPDRAADRQRLLLYLPLSLFYILFAFLGSYLFGILKGIADVFGRKHRVYRTVQGAAWLVDAIPMFGVVVLLELGTLYGAMYIKGFPLSMIPDQTFIGGDLVPALILMWAPMMYISRILAVAIKQQLGEQYVLTAHSKGLFIDHVFWRHVYRNCIPKLVNEAPAIFTMVMSSLLALEFLSFRWGGMFDMFVAMGHGQLGARSLYASPSKFQLPLVAPYLIVFTTITVIAQIVARALRSRWEVKPNA